MRRELPSGKYIDVTPLPCEQAWEVAQTVLRVVEKMQLDLKGVDFDALLVTDILAFKGPICTLLGSKEINDVVKQCFSRCSYNQVKINEQTFEPVECRQDFLPCAYYALKENAYPFFGSLVSFLKTN